MAEAPPQVLPESLRAAIARDLRPVSPLASPAQRMLWVLPLAVLLLVGSELAFGLRLDAPDLGITVTWGASIGQMLLGLLLIAAALREAVPGTTLTRRAVGTAVATAAAAVAGITWITWRMSPTLAAPRTFGFVWQVCFAGTIAGALPVLAVAGWLVARAFPLRPAVAGALYGLGAGLLADAGWRLFCHFPGPAHVFGAHTAGIIVVAVMGAVLASLLARRR